MTRKGWALVLTPPIITVLAFCIVAGYYIHMKVRAAHYARINLAKLYHVPVSRVHVTYVSPLGNVEQKLLSHDNWNAIFEIDGMKSENVGNVCEFRELKTGTFFGFFLPTALS